MEFKNNTDTHIGPISLKFKLVYPEFTSNHSSFKYGSTVTLRIPKYGYWGCTDYYDNTGEGDLFCDVYCVDDASECKCTNTVKLALANITGTYPESPVIAIILEYCNLIYAKKNMVL